jgi:acetyltransferase-like isoleucine patch superfamily enzyme
MSGGRTVTEARFHHIVPGAVFEGDWFGGRVPVNIAVGRDCVTDSSYTFKQFFAQEPRALTLGDDVTLWRTALSLEEAAQLSIGSHCYLANVSIACARRIRIGSYVMVAGGTTIVDSDFHPLDPAARLADAIALSPIGNRAERPAVEADPVDIGDDVWIGPNSTVLKGVRIGDGAVVGAGSVVLDDVDPGVYVTGNPARPAASRI